jgi:hypothetical protein
MALLTGIAIAVAPIFAALDTHGTHDWDQMESHRYLVVKSILRYRQFPFWNPYSCGGHPAWAGLESGTVVVSPWLPFYLLLKLTTALRAEIVGSALLGAIGAWLLAGRFTKSAVVRALVCAVFAFNGRWALQIAVGHTWHLVYALTPWAFFFFDRAVGRTTDAKPPRLRESVLAAAVVALMVYMGGIYPVPQTVVALALYGCLLAMATRSFRPIWVGALIGVMSFGLAAPKLLPLFEIVGRYPRFIDSHESVDLNIFITAFTAVNQDLGSQPAKTPQWGWHEWGIYIGWIPFVFIAATAVRARGTHQRALVHTGLILLLLGFGSFHEYAPWTLMHELPIFKSQHVPSRWQYPALLLLAIGTAAVLERWLHRLRGARPVAEVVLVGALLFVAQDIARVSNAPISHAFGNTLPPIKESTGPFHTEKSLPPDLRYSHTDWAPPSLPAEIANIGTIDCGTFPGLHNYVRDDRGNAPGLGAKGTGDPAYRGEAFLASGNGSAVIDSWTPNEVVIRIEGANVGDVVLLNQNWDPGWRVNSKPSINHADLAGGRVTAPAGLYVFRYRPRLWWPALAVFCMTVAGIVLAYRLRRRTA